MLPRERSRRNLVALITFIYLLLIFEGAVRKWLLPSQGQLLYFIRDPFVLVAYAMALRSSFFPRNSPMFTAGIALACVSLLLIVAQTLGASTSADKWLMLATYGWRNYFFYIPLAFLIGATFERADVERIAKLTFLIAIPVAILVSIQFKSPINAPINVGIAENAAQQFRGLSVNADHTRPMGTFTSDLGQKQFVLSLVAFALSLWILPAARRYLKSWQLVAATGAVLTCLAVSGSRGAMVGSGLIVVAAVASSAIVRGRGFSGRAVLVPALLVVGAVILYPLVFPEGYTAFVDRWNAAANAESQHFSFGIFGRALYGFVDFVSLLGTTPLQGYGIGLAGNASILLGATIEGFTGWAETDWARHIVDLGPVVGVVFIGYRIALVSWLGARCLAGARRNSDPLPLLLFAYIGIELLYGQATGHGTVNGYSWIFMGLCLAASAPATAAVDAQAADAPAPMRFANLMR